MSKIYAFHLLNDYSGSPKVLGQLLRGWARAGYAVELHTSAATEGFLSDLPDVATRDNRYRFHGPLPLRLWALLFSQLYTLLSLWSRVQRGDTVYVNTLLPFGAAILGRLKGARVIYHLHETSVSPLLFKRFLLACVRMCASEVIYVSAYLANQEPVGKPSTILWNAIPAAFVARVPAMSDEREVKTVLMLASLKAYKGVDEFVALARACPLLCFELVANASEPDIHSYFSATDLPPNLTVFPAQRDVHPFYRRADVVVNLSRPEEWTETFGLTALEAMAYGRPVVVPPVGGIAEIVTDGQVGFHRNGRHTAGIAALLRGLAGDPARYADLSRRARTHAAGFSEARFLELSRRLLENPPSKSWKPVRIPERMTE